MKNSSYQASYEYVPRQRFVIPRIRQETTAGEGGKKGEQETKGGTVKGACSRLDTPQKSMMPHFLARSRCSAWMSIQSTRLCSIPARAGIFKLFPIWKPRLTSCMWRPAPIRGTLVRPTSASGTRSFAPGIFAKCQPDLPEYHENSDSIWSHTPEPPHFAGGDL